ncbi:hypothetical protein NX722_02550 [Endozoicomonas gorgoniicola]|uniref:Uncharacterized protein n=1 Tax=Endozoicomonas gorgoniicola TaxID=1234144 RepID=A0ABT3MQ84_9GAMM|nr:hypothetical protein [Endozoicomonas gorgoniicola]MCW7551541.1 hypothetical protein [Endozoicomonas gorgoniicola]
MASAPVLYNLPVHLACSTQEESMKRLYYLTGTLNSVSQISDDLHNN